MNDYIRALEDVIKAIEESSYCQYCDVDDCKPTVCAECLDYVDKALLKMVKAMADEYYDD